MSAEFKDYPAGHENQDMIVFSSRKYNIPVLFLEERRFWTDLHKKACNDGGKQNIGN